MTAKEIVRFYKYEGHKRVVPDSDEWGMELIRRLERAIFAINLSHGNHNYVHLNNDILMNTSLDVIEYQGEPTIIIRVYDVVDVRISVLLEDDPGTSLINERIEEMNEDIDNLMKEMGERIEEAELLKKEWEETKEKTF